LRGCYEETGQASQFEKIFRDQILEFRRAGEALKEAIIGRGSQIAAERGPLAQAFQRPMKWASRGGV
jgi:hypothetical protein